MASSEQIEHDLPPPPGMPPVPVIIPHAEADGEEAEMFENPLQNKKRKLREEELKRIQEELDRQLERMRMANTTKKKKKAGGKKDDDEMVEMSDLTAPPDLSPAMPPQFSEADRLAKGLRFQN